MRDYRSMVSLASRSTATSTVAAHFMRSCELAVPAHFGSPATLALLPGPVVLRPRLTAGLPFRVQQYA